MTGLQSCKGRMLIDSFGHKASSQTHTDSHVATAVTAITHCVRAVKISPDKSVDEKATTRKTRDEISFKTRLENNLHSSRI